MVWGKGVRGTQMGRISSQESVSIHHSSLNYTAQSFTLRKWFTLTGNGKAENNLPFPLARLPTCPTSYLLAPSGGLTLHFPSSSLEWGNINTWQGVEEGWWASESSPPYWEMHVWSQVSKQATIRGHKVSICHQHVYAHPGQLQLFLANGKLYV